MNGNIRRLKELPCISIILVALNVIIFLICTFTGRLLYNIGEFGPAVFLDDNEFYRIIFSMFLHADISHLVNNMLLLAGLGAMLEKETGHVVFFLLYIFSGLGGQVFSLLYKMYNNEWYVTSIGASGAVFGMVGVLLAMSLCIRGGMENVTWQRIVFVVAYSVYSGAKASNIDNAAHIGGVIVGFILGIIMCFFQNMHNNRRNRNIYRNGWE